MNQTLGDILPHLAPFCDGGVCTDDAGGPDGLNRGYLRINEAVQRLSTKAGWPGLIQCVRMCAYNGCITCGRDIRKILKAKIDGEFTNVFDKWYEFLEGGPGMLSDDTSSFIDLIDRDQVVTQYEIPEPMRVMVFSDTIELATSCVLIRGFDETNREVRSQVDGAWIMGEYVPITRDVGYYTQSKYSMITSVQKPVTNGYVYLSAVTADDWSDPGTFTREHLAGYHPDETRPEYRRYAFKTDAYSVLLDRSYRVNALVKMRLVPMTRLTDICLIDNMPAIKMMLQAMRYYDSGDLNKGREYEKQAERILLEDVDDFETVQVNPEIQIHGLGVGDITNV